jgi:hypothetical protein
MVMPKGTSLREPPVEVTVGALNFLTCAAPTHIYKAFSTQLYFPILVFP